MSENWPVHLEAGELILQPLRWRDRRRWLNVRNENRDWLAEWEATLPQVPGESGAKELPTFFEMVSWHRREGRQGRSYAFAIWQINSQGKNLIGQITLGGIIFGAMRGAHIGYWIDQRYSNRGYTTRAVKLLTKFGFEDLKLHRIEINLRPENEPSKKVALKAGYLLEGSRNKYLHIAGDWRDHITFVRENPEVK